MYKLLLSHSIDDDENECISLIVENNYLENISYITHDVKIYYDIKENDDNSFYFMVGNCEFNIEEYHKFLNNLTYGIECLHVGIGISFLDNKISFNTHKISTSTTFYLTSDERVQFSNELRQLEYLLNYSNIICQ